MAQPVTLLGIDVPERGTSGAAVAELVGRVRGRPVPPGDPGIARLAAATAGNPLRVRQAAAGTGRQTTDRHDDARHEGAQWGWRSPFSAT